MEKYSFECLRPPNSTLTAKDNIIIFQDKDGSEKVTPISALIGITLFPPPKPNKEGKIAFFTHRNAMSQMASLGIGPEGAANCVYAYLPAWSKDVENFYQYVLSVINKHTDGFSVASLGDEILKLESLFSKGILSVEEFELAKKKLLES